jgi:hypothetical protein
MAIQFPGPVNQISLPRIDQALQAKEMNALNIDAAKQQMDEGDRIATGKFLLGLGKMGAEAIQADPNWYANNLQQIVQEFQARGLPTEKIPPAGTSPQQLLQDFAKLQEAGQMAVIGQPPERYEDVMQDGRSYWCYTKGSVKPDAELCRTAEVG